MQALVKRAIQAGQRIRIIGSGHSFNPLWLTEDILISLDNYQGLVATDPSSGLVTVKGGTKLNLLGELLYAEGLAMENLGDIDAQSIAGTIATGTHGTGLAFGTIATQVRGIKFINGLGEIVYCSPDEQADLFKAAQVSLGALGIITEVTLQCVPAYRLELRSRKEPLATVLAEFYQRHQQHRNFEFYWFPHSDLAWTKTANIVSQAPNKSGIINYLTEYVLENGIFKILCESARWFPRLNRYVARLSAAAIPSVNKVFHSHKVYATKRLVRFNEQEYSVPLTAFPAVFAAIRDLVNKRNFPVHFPIECRVVKKDDAYLSPAYGRDSAYLACHVYHKKDHQLYFAALEQIFLAHGGRPHWGKRHTLTAQELDQRYPKFQAFLEHRRTQDPKGLFLNAYLQNIFGLGTAK